MVVPAIFLFLSSGLAGYSILQYGMVFSDLMLLAVVVGAASLILLFQERPRAGRRSSPKTPKAGQVSLFLDGPRAARKSNTQTPRASQVLVDGSNVMHWKEGVAQLGTLIEVLQVLKAEGFAPGVVFDANAGYKLQGRFLRDHELASLLGLPVHHVLVAPKGTQADYYLLMVAREQKLRIVTNDRFRDWTETFPEVQDAGLLIKGGYRDGKVWVA